MREEEKEIFAEALRRIAVFEINKCPLERPALEQKHGIVWTAQELVVQYELLGVSAPFVVAVDKATGKKGSLMFQHNPRFYFAWQEDTRV